MDFYLGIWAGLNETWPNGNYTQMQPTNKSFHHSIVDHFLTLQSCVSKKKSSTGSKKKKKKNQEEVWPPGAVWKWLIQLTMLPNYWRSFTLIGWVWVVYAWSFFFLYPAGNCEYLFYPGSRNTSILYSVFLAVPPKKHKTFSKTDRAMAFKQTIRTAWGITRHYSPNDFSSQNKSWNTPVHTGFSDCCTVKLELAAHILSLYSEETRRWQ